MTYSQRTPTTKETILRIVGHDKASLFDEYMARWDKNHVGKLHNFKGNEFHYNVYACKRFIEIWGKNRR